MRMLNSLSKSTFFAMCAIPEVLGAKVDQVQLALFLYHQNIRDILIRLSIFTRKVVSHYFVLAIRDLVPSLQGGLVGCSTATGERA